MPDEATVLTALGLDTAGFEDGVSRSVGVMNTFTRALNLADVELRRIPIIGEIYAATLGHIATGFAEVRTQGREFARIMSTDVAGSLTGTTAKIEDINAAITELQRGSLGRSIADGIKIAAAALQGDNLSPGKERDAQQLVLQQQRALLIASLPDLLKREGNAQSALISGSERLTELTRIELETRQRILAMTAESRKFYGPDREADRAAFVAQQTAIIEKQSALQKEGANADLDVQRRQLETAKNISDLQDEGNDSPRALAALNLMQAEYELGKAITEEDKKAGEIKVAIAANNLSIAVRVTALTQAQRDLATNEAQIRRDGFNEAVKSAEAELRFAQEKARLAQGARAQQEAATDVQNAETGVKIAKENRAQYTASLAIAQAIAQVHDTDAATQDQTLAMQEKAARESIVRMRAEVGFSDAIKAKEVELAQIQKQRWENSIRLARTQLSIQESLIAAQTGLSVADQSAAMVAQLQAAKGLLTQLAALGSPKDQIAAQQAQIKRLDNALKEQKLQTAETLHNEELQSVLMDQQLRGQTLAANQTQIRLTYETRIADAVARGNTLLAARLTKQKESAELSEAIREYELGGRGRALERQEQRRREQTARIVESQRRAAANAAKRAAGGNWAVVGFAPPGQHMGIPIPRGLPRGLQGSALDARPQPKAPAKVVLTGAEQFQKDVIDQLKNVNTALSG